ncbi:MAG: hypothetical protein HZC49_14750 [Nitrospirae bacterium]|nr:hypothetical protein [Nitrospirota bacterium]
MRKRIVLMLSALFIIIPSLSHAQLDLEQEVLVIPDTHDAEPYKWKKPWSIWDLWNYKLRLEYGTLIAGSDSEFTFYIKSKTAIHDVHVFITDKGLNVFKHLRPESENGKYKFIFNAPSQGKYRFEFVFKTDKDVWINLSENISIKEGVKNQILQEQDKDYSVNVKLIPEKVYAEHVVTLIYQVSHNGVPVRYPDKIDGSDILLASWDESGKDFIFMASRQNVDGQIAVSLVFMRPGMHRVFAEFKHNGAVRVFDHEVEVLKEPPVREHGISYKDENPYD